MKILTDEQVRRVFGDPGKYMVNGVLSPLWEAEQLGRVRLLKPLRLAWDTKHTVTSFKAHRKVVSMLEMALKELAIRPWLWDTINDFGGCYAFRQVRGAKSLSRHSWGIAVDLDVLDNPFLGKIPRVNKDVRFIMKEHGFAWGGAAVWGGDFPWARRDAQHWEFADLSLLK